MRFKSQQKHSTMPDVNLIPMMDVIMTILTFFILVSMTLAKQQQALDVTLPNASAGVTDFKTPDPMVVGLNVRGGISIADKATTEAELTQKIQAYLTQNPQGAVLLKADRKVSYEQLAKSLGVMQKVGGEKVSLAIDPES
jgi:biopolymer transport protein ExbD